MKGLQALLLIGVLFVTVLVLNSVDAAKKDYNGREVENKQLKNGKPDKVNKYQSSRAEQNHKSTESQVEEDSNIETKKYKVKSGTKHTVKNIKTMNEGGKPKITLRTQKTVKVKNSKEIPITDKQQFTSRKTTEKKTKQRINKEETVDKTYKTVKKIKTRSIKENNEDVLSDDLNNLFDTNKNNEEHTVNDKKKKKYKLVEVVLEEEKEEDQEANANETIIDIGSENDEFIGVYDEKNEETDNNFKKTKLPNTKETVRRYTFEEFPDEEMDIANEVFEAAFAEDFSPDIEKPLLKYENSENPTCKLQPDDPNRKGPKKLTLYVIEEEVNGKTKKRVEMDEDGVTMCEMADLLQDHFYGGLE